MLFGRLRAPYPRLAAELRGLRAVAPLPRGSSSRPVIALIAEPRPHDRVAGDYVGLDRLDREELDE